MSFISRHICKKCNKEVVGTCKPCRRLYELEWYAKNKDRYLKVTAAWYAKNKDRAAATAKIRSALPEVAAKRHSEENKKRNRDYNKTLPRRAKLTERQRLRARKIRYDELGLSDYEKRITHFIYKASNLLSKIIGVEYHVDHKIPISRGGKHHPNNLQIMLGIDNMRKSANI